MPDEVALPYRAKVINKIPLPKSPFSDIGSETGQFLLLAGLAFPLAGYFSFLKAIERTSNLRKTLKDMYSKEYLESKRQLHSERIAMAIDKPTDGVFSRIGHAISRSYHHLAHKIIELPFASTFYKMRSIATTAALFSIGPVMMPLVAPVLGQIFLGSMAAVAIGLPLSRHNEIKSFLSEKAKFLNFKKELREETELREQHEQIREEFREEARLLGCSPEQTASTINEIDSILGPKFTKQQLIAIYAEARAEVENDKLEVARLLLEEATEPLGQNEEATFEISTEADPHVRAANGNGCAIELHPEQQLAAEASTQATTVGSCSPAAATQILSGP